MALHFRGIWRWGASTTLLPSLHHNYSWFHQWFSGTCHELRNLIKSGILWERIIKCTCWTQRIVHATIELRKKYSRVRNSTVDRAIPLWRFFIRTPNAQIKLSTAVGTNISIVLNFCQNVSQITFTGVITVSGTLGIVQLQQDIV